MGYSPWGHEELDMAERLTRKKRGKVWVDDRGHPAHFGWPPGLPLCF